jgi:hypothetical protein
MSQTIATFDLRMMVRAPGRVESCAKIAMRVLRNICTAMDLLRQPKRPKLILTERRAVQILVIMKWAEQRDASTLRLVLQLAAVQSSCMLESGADAQAAAEAGGRAIDQAAAISIISANR